MVEEAERSGQGRRVATLRHVAEQAACSTGRLSA